MAATYSAALRTSRQQAIVTALGAGGSIRIGTAGMASTLVTWTLNSTPGTVSGDVLTLSPTSTRAGTWVRLADAVEALAITNTAPLTVEAEQSVSRSFYVEHAVGEPSMTVTSYSPFNPGLTFNTATFSLTGTVYSPGNYTVNLSASDGAGRTATAVFYLTVTETEEPPL